jgi:hypothetical protein
MPNKPCSRCGGERSHWSDEWPNYGRIEVGAAARIWDDIGTTDPPRDHPLFPPSENDGHQGAVFQWTGGSSYRFADSNYQMCRSCQRALLRILGDFFGLRKEIKRDGA